MGITLKNVKGSALTHAEMDTNFTELYYSSSHDENSFTLYKSQSLNNEYKIYKRNPGGDNYAIQFKSGSDEYGPSARFSGSNNFIYNYDIDELQLSGSANISGSLTVGGTVYAQEFRSELVQSSIIYESGSTKFGDSSDDVHQRTGSLTVQGAITGSDVLIDDWNSVSASLASNNLYTTNVSSSLASDLTSISSSIDVRIDNVSSSLDSRITSVSASTDTRIDNVSSSLAASITANSSSTDTRIDNVSSSLNNRITSVSSSIISEHLKNTTDTFTGTLTVSGDVTVTGGVTAQTFKTELVTSSIIYESGSTKFGDSADDVHQRTGSFEVLGDLTVSGDIAGNITGSAASASYVLGANVDGEVANAATASYVLNAISSSFATSVEISEDTDPNNYDVLYRNLGGVISTDTSGDFAYNPSTNTLTVDFITGNAATATTASYVSAGNVDGTVANATTASHALNTLTASYALNGGSGLLEMSGDTTPQLGGNLDLNSFKISGSGDIEAVSGSFSGPLESSGSLMVSGTFDSTGDATFGNNLYITGSVFVQGDVTAYDTSDERLKDNIQVIPSAVDKVQSLRGVSFDWNEQSDFKGHDIGVIAQDVEKVLPELVVDRNTGFKAVKYDKIVAVLIEAIKEQQTQIDELRYIIDSQRNH